jgi:hypothetical protein
MTWPEEQVCSTEVREWIRSQIPLCEGVVGPTVVYRVNGWGVTARFALKRPAEQAGSAAVDGAVVCKICYSPEDANAPRMHGILREGGRGARPGAAGVAGAGWSDVAAVRGL